MPILILAALLPGCMGAAKSVHRSDPMMSFASAEDAGGSSGATPAAVTDPAAPAAAALPAEKLVVTGYLSMSVDHGPDAMKAIRASVESAGGRVVNETESGQDYGWSGHLTLRLPPGEVDAFVTGLAKVGAVTSRRIEATDVSRQFFDQELAIQNLKVTAARLQALLADNPNLTTAEVLEIEREMTRVRGDLERIEGEHRFLADRIAWATFDIDLTGSGSVVLAPKAHVHPGARGSMLYLIDAATGVNKVRMGAGGTLWFRRSYSLELDVFPATDDDTGRAVMISAGGATYSDFFGAGRKRALNPFLGGRMGYAFLGDEHYFDVSGELGVELFKHEHVIVDVAARIHALIGKDGVDPAVQATAGIVVPF